MYSKTLFLLLSAIVFIDLSTANKDSVSVLCQLAEANSLWLPIGNRKCITGCLGDPKNHPTIFFNQCEPDLEPGAVRQPFYKGISIFLRHIDFCSV